MIEMKEMKEMKENSVDGSREVIFKLVVFC